MLPLVKNFGAELGFETAGRAIMVLGGSGFTTDYPVEQALRDSRVFAIYEGTTGMQAQDFVLRQCLADDGGALEGLLDTAAAETGDLPEAADIVERFRDFFTSEVQPAGRAAQLAMAEPVMRAGWLAVQAWMCTRMAAAPEAETFLSVAGPSLDREIARARLQARRSASPEE